ncbi:hypothetical protein NLN86_19860, partial [Citrobacter portucalensis]
IKTLVTSEVYMNYFKMLFATLTLATSISTAISKDLPASCMTISDQTNTPGEMGVTITNNCGECAIGRVNTFLNGNVLNFDGNLTLQPNQSSRQTVQLNKGFGTYQIKVLDVKSCN